jgi:phosphohistidine phosphatase
MFLLLAHHADAVAASVDPMRPLSPLGREQAAHVAGRVGARGVRPSAVWHSGKLRARQTGEILWAATNPMAAFTAVRHLQPDDDPAWMRDAVAGEADDLMIVGHYPHLPALLRLLTGGDAGFPQHGVVALESTGDGWTERWREAVLTT